jgi:hypothetical protein
MQTQLNLIWISNSIKCSKIDGIWVKESDSNTKMRITEYCSVEIIMEVDNPSYLWAKSTQLMQINDLSDSSINYTAFKTTFCYNDNDGNKTCFVDDLEGTSKTNYYLEDDNLIWNYSWVRSSL